jgi:hypothetical protein
MPLNFYGFDEVVTNILKNNIHIISSPLTHFNQSVSTGTFPLYLKYSVVITLYKRGDKHYVSNYRPISLRTSFYRFLGKK